MKIQFLGANRQVTGSRYLLEAGGLRLLIDCGLFQERAFESRNWENPVVDPSSIDMLILTHAHLDHTGLIPRLVAGGYDKPILATEPTVELAEIVMLDSARIQAEDVKYKVKRHKREGRKSPHPYVPLYTIEDAERASGLLIGMKYRQPRKLNEHVTVTFREAGHILGAACLEFEINENGQTRRVLFSGDIGQDDKPFLNDPSMLDGADYVIMESTYGDRNHRDAGEPTTQLARIIKRTAKRGGNVVIPTFAIERAQELIFHIGELVHDDLIPDLPIFLDSPMAVDVTNLFKKYREYWNVETARLFDSGRPPLHYQGLKLVRSVDESKAINHQRGPCVIMSSSGMCTGGRIKHHLKHNIENPNATIVFVGYQAEGTLGRVILQGKPEVRIHGKPYTVRADIDQIHGFSAHADRDDLLEWCAAFKQAPKKLFLTHGDGDVADKLAKRTKGLFDWDVTVPSYKDVVELD